MWQRHLQGSCQEPKNNLTGNTHIPTAQCESRSLARRHCKQGAEPGPLFASSLLIALSLENRDYVVAGRRGNTSRWGRLETLAKLAGVSRSYRPHRGNGCQPNSYQFTHAGVNRAWHGEGQHRVGGVPQFDVLDPFGKDEKISGTCPFMCLVLKREQRQTKLTTALWYWQHCYWHHNWELLKLYRWHQQTIATALFYSGEQHQEMSLDRIFDMARSFAGKTVPFSNFLQHRKNCCLFQNWSLFGCLLIETPFPQVTNFPYFGLHWQRANFRILGTFFQLGQNSIVAAFPIAFCSGTPKENFHQFSLVWYRAQAAVLHSGAIGGHPELWQLSAMQCLQLKNSMKILSQNFLR